MHKAYASREAIVQRVLNDATGGLIMPDSMMLVPMRQSFCLDLIRFSDGIFTPESIGDLAEEQILNLLDRAWDGHGELWFGERAFEFAEIYFPDIANEMLKFEAKGAGLYSRGNKPLVWKEVTVPHGAGVRMTYRDEHHYGEVKNGRIVDQSGSYSPSEWASKVADGTSRNAWRDLWFKDGPNWLPAQMLRDKAKAALNSVFEGNSKRSRSVP
jgi:hypothetical protein